MVSEGVTRVKKVDVHELIRIIEAREPRGKFYSQDGEYFIGVDNRTGDAWTEAFKKKIHLERWMNDEFEIGEETP